MMGHGHELGQGGVPEDGIVRQADVSDVEVNELGAVVVACAEGDWEMDAEGDWRRICPREWAMPPPTPKKGLLRQSRSSGT